MRPAPLIFAVTVVLSGCAFNAGAGVGARLGERPGAMSAQCDNFESCDVVYQDALGVAARCHEEGGDCEDEERNVSASYEQLREQTLLELDALRHEVREREAVFREPEPAQPGPIENGPDGSGPGRQTEPPAPPRRGNGWFESEAPPVR
ncbi:MAG TPA: hypothetical protein VGM29_00725 [Polyangiaceae bacterium]